MIYSCDRCIHCWTPSLLIVACLTHSLGPCLHDHLERPPVSRQGVERFMGYSRLFHYYLSWHHRIITQHLLHDQLRCSTWEIDRSHSQQSSLKHSQLVVQCKCCCGHLLTSNDIVKGWIIIQIHGVWNHEENRNSFNLFIYYKQYASILRTTSYSSAVPKHWSPWWWQIVPKFNLMVFVVIVTNPSYRHNSPTLNVADIDQPRLDSVTAEEEKTEQTGLLLCSVEF